MGLRRKWGAFTLAAGLFSCGAELNAATDDLSAQAESEMISIGVPKGGEPDLPPAMVPVAARQRRNEFVIPATPDLSGPRLNERTWTDAYGNVLTLFELDGFGRRLEVTLFPGGLVADVWQGAYTAVKGAYEQTDTNTWTSQRWKQVAGARHPVQYDQDVCLGAASYDGTTPCPGQRELWRWEDQNDDGAVDRTYFMTQERHPQGAWLRTYEVETVDVDGDRTPDEQEVKFWERTYREDGEDWGRIFLDNMLGVDGKVDLVKDLRRQKDGTLRERTVWARSFSGVTL